MNKAMFVGNLARDPELKTTQSGVAVCTFTVAVNRMRDANGESRADYLPVKTFKNRAENCAKYLSKGSKVAIEGPVQTYSYEAQDGSKRYGFEIVATEIMFLPSGNRSDAHNGGGQTASRAHLSSIPAAVLPMASHRWMTTSCRSDRRRPIRGHRTEMMNANRKARCGGNAKRERRSDAWQLPRIYGPM